VEKNDQRGSRSGDASGEGGVRDPEALFTSHLEFIRRVVRHVAGRRMLSPEDRDDFEAEVHLKLIGDDYAVLRRFEGRSSITTYLVTVIQRVFLDFQIRRWGKWRPSAAARELGLLAVELERLMHHEGRGFEEACSILTSASGGVPVDRARLADLYARLPRRPARRSDGPEGLEEAPAPDGRADASLMERENRESARRAQALLGEALALLTPEERLLVRLTILEGLTIAAVAVMLGGDQRPLYRSRERCLGTMRRHLEAHGIDAATVADLLARPAALIELPAWRRQGMETGAPGPSHSEGAATTGKDETDGVS
jgi:RNA polymerase sigma factor (sigma-70 family)